MASCLVLQMPVRNLVRRRWNRVPFDVSKTLRRRREELTETSSSVNETFLTEQKSCQGQWTSTTSLPSSILFVARRGLTKTEKEGAGIFKRLNTDRGSAVGMRWVEERWSN